MKNLTIALTTLLLCGSFINATIWKCPGQTKNFKTRAEAKAYCGDDAYWITKPQWKPRTIGLYYISWVMIKLALVVEISY